LFLIHSTLLTTQHNANTNSNTKHKRTLLVAFSRYFAVNIRPDWWVIASRSDAMEAANDRWEDIVLFCWTLLIVDS
jgi:myo-inositol catabolism protein IolC